jgi:hypothetical protein
VNLACHNSVGSVGHGGHWSESVEWAQLASASVHTEPCTPVPVPRHWQLTPTSTIYDQRCPRFASLPWPGADRYPVTLYSFVGKRGGGILPGLDRCTAPGADRNPVLTPVLVSLAPARLHGPWHCGAGKQQATRIVMNEQEQLLWSLWWIAGLVAEVVPFYVPRPLD